MNISYFNIPNDNYDAILPLRVLLLKITNKRVYDLICLLMGHEEALTETKLKKYKKISNLIRNIWNFCEDFTTEEIIKVLGILSVNSFCVHDGEEDGTGLIGLYPWTSLMSHSCLPNIKIVTKSDFSYICEAVVNISQGTEIVTSYHHYYYHLFGTINRREHIRNNWKFDCKCSRCEDPTEYGTFVSGVNCPLCKTGVMLPKEPLNYNSKWQCSSCQATELSENIKAIVGSIETEMESVPDSMPEKLENMLSEVECKLHENHYLLTDTKRRLIDIYGHQTGYLYNDLDKSVVEKKILYCNHLLELAKQLSPGKSELRGYLLWERFGAQNHLLQEWDLASLTSLLSLKQTLKEVVAIFAPIRKDSVEGLSGRKAALELKRIEEQLRNL